MVREIKKTKKRKTKTTCHAAIKAWVIAVNGLLNSSIVSFNDLSHNACRFGELKLTVETYFFVYDRH